MNIEIVENGNQNTAVVESDINVIVDVQSAIDFIATIRYTTPCDSIIINKNSISEDFFDLKSGLAGEVLQKFINYKMSIAIVGDFSLYSSKSLRDFIYECNKGKHIYFAENNEEAFKAFRSV